MAYYGNTLTELTSGINAAEAIQARAREAQGAQGVNRMANLAGWLANRESTAAAREAATLQAAAQMQQLRQANEAAELDRAMKERQFDVLQQSEMDRLLKTIEANKAIAEIQSKSFDPRLANAFTRLLTPEAERAAEKSDLAEMANVFTTQRKALTAKKKEWKEKEMTAWYPDWAPWGGGTERNAQIAELDKLISALDARASALGLVATADGGYVTPYSQPTPAARPSPIPTNPPAIFDLKTNILPRSVTGPSAASTNLQKFLFLGPGNYTLME